MSISFQLRPRRSASRLYLDRSSSFCVLSMSTSASCHTANLQLTLTLAVMSTRTLKLGSLAGSSDMVRVSVSFCGKCVLNWCFITSILTTSPPPRMA